MLQDGGHGWPKPSFWREHLSQKKNHYSVEEEVGSMIKKEERINLCSYRRRWRREYATLPEHKCSEPADRADWTEISVCLRGPGIRGRDVQSLDNDSERPAIYFLGLSLIGVDFGCHVRHGANTSLRAEHF